MTNTKALPLFMALTLAFAVIARCAGLIPIALQDGEHVPPVQIVESYRDVLAQIPPELHGTKPKAWTQIQREDVNAALKESLIDHQIPGKLVLKVSDIADWNGWTFYANIPNQEGYPIRVFGKFTDEWKEKFSTLKKGDMVLLEGVLSSVTYRDLWGKFTLSICLKDCTFTKVASSNEPSVSL